MLRAVRLVRLVVAVALTTLAGPVSPAPPALAQVPAVELVPVVGGLSQPVFVTHDGTGSGVLYIVEQGGLIRQLAPGATSATTFADLRGKIATGGERGLPGSRSPRSRTRPTASTSFTRGRATARS